MTNTQTFDWDGTGFRVAWKERRSLRWFRRLQLLDDDLTPINITTAGYTFAVAVYADATSTTVLKSFTIITAEYTTGYVAYEVAAADATLAVGTYYVRATINRGTGAEPFFHGVFEVTA